MQKIKFAPQHKKKDIYNQPIYKFAGADQCNRQLKIFCLVGMMEHAVYIADQ